MPNTPFGMVLPWSCGRSHWCIKVKAIFIVAQGRTALCWPGVVEIAIAILKKISRTIEAKAAGLCHHFRVKLLSLSNHHSLRSYTDESYSLRAWGRCEC